MQWFPAIGAVGLLMVLSTLLGHAEDVPPASLAHVVSVSADGVQRATVQLDSYAFRPSHLIIEAGKPVELTLTSVTIITPHNFIIDDPAAGFEIEQEVSAGETVTVTFTPTRPGLFTVSCDKRLWPMPSHRDKGMVGKLEVKE